MQPLSPPALPSLLIVLLPGTRKLYLYFLSCFSQAGVKYIFNMSKCFILKHIKGISLFRKLSKLRAREEGVLLEVRFHCKSLKCGLKAF